MEAFDRYIHQNETTSKVVDRTKHSMKNSGPKFRAVLEKASKSNGFDTNLEPCSFQLMDAQETNTLMRRIMEDGIVLLCPLHGANLANVWKIPLGQVLTELFHATKIGLSSI